MGAAIFFALLAGRAGASLVAYEPFNYSTSIPSGTASTASGFAGNWTCSTTPSVVAGLTYTALPVANNSFSSTSGRQSVALASPLVSGTKWISFLFSQSGNNGGNICGLYFPNGGTGLFFGFGLAPFSGTQGGLGLGSTATASASPQGATNLASSFLGTYGTTYLVALKIDFNTSGNNDTVTVYLNPTANAAAPGVAATYTVSTFDVGTITGIGFQNTGGGFAIRADEVRVGDSYADVSGGSGGPPPVAPFISSVSPNSGPTNGGTTVTITGSNFLAGVTVKFGANFGTAVLLVNALNISVTTPSGVAGAVNLVVQNTNTLAATNLNGFTYFAPTNVSPALAKKWPESGLRGISLSLIAPVDGNSQDPGQFLSDATFQKMAQWRVNCVRLVVSFDAGSIWDVPSGTTIPPVPPGEPLAPYRTNLAALRVALPLAEKYGISVVILCEPLARYVPFTYPPGQATGGWQDGYLQLWQAVAAEFGSRANVIGYDLLNEPHGADEGAHWRPILLPLVQQTIRAVDTNTYLIVEPWEWSFPSALAGFAPLADAKVVYSFHHYAPHGYTHQKIQSYTGPDYDDKPYPGLLCTFTPPPVLWDKAALENSMQAAINFRATNNAIIWVGEFSALRWAPGAAQWVKDSIEIFEKYHFSWNYHMYGGWNGWNPTFDPVEASNNNTDGGKATDRLQALLDGWQKNSIMLAASPFISGQFQFVATGLTVGRTNVIQVSTNLVSWTSISTNVAPDSYMSFTNPVGMKSQFFRLVQLSIPSNLVTVLAPTGLQTIPSGSTNAIGLAWTASATAGVIGYRIYYGTDSGQLTNTLDVGNVTSANVGGLISGQTYFLAVIALTASGQSLLTDALITAQPDANASIIALFNASTPLEPLTTVVTSNALITYLADRARDRHARESQFSLYDHYLSWYWEQRMANIEIIDRVGRNGGTTITFNYTTQAELNPAEFRTFFRGINTVAEYNNNQIATLVSTNVSATPGETDFNYSATVTANNQFNRALQLGDRVEIEISQFLLAPRHGRNNYYGTVLLYIVGQGIVPWAEGQDVGLNGGIVAGINQSLDSYPLSTNAWLGGLTTLPYQYSAEPQHRFKETAGNISPTNGLLFMLGRRLHHTDFGDGSHSEPDNPIFTEHVGQLGPKFINRSCVACHVNNGRALPAAVGTPLTKWVFKVGSDANGSPHPTLGSVFQPQSASGPNEGSVSIASYTTTSGQYGDSTPYSLQKPNYAFQGTTPVFFSARIAPQLVGLGLLEAVSESSIQALADPSDTNADGISGRMQTLTDPETAQLRLGRFGYKGAKARVSHQVAGALNTDMGVATSIFPKLDGETNASAVEISAADLDKMTRYVALLGVAARRDLTNAQALLGEQLFASANCVKCHTPTLTTSPFHPMTELRNQTIHPYTDLLLHDLGPGLADNMGEGIATGSEWRTPPLWSIGLTAGVSGGEAYLHDGRARTLEEAILWHGGEADASKELFRTMTATNRAAVIAFLKSL